MKTKERGAIPLEMILKMLSSVQHLILTWDLLFYRTLLGWLAKLKVVIKIRLKKKKH
jgi:hypothetical protein